MEATDDAGYGDDIVVACAYTTCERNQHVQVGVCEDCIPGSTRPAGDTTHTGLFAIRNTFHIVFEIYRHICMHLCKTISPCILSYITFKGSTDCEHTLCSIDEHVVDHHCESCNVQLGFYNPRKGDDATGNDTSCIARTCTGMYYVQNHDCIQCPPGQYNPWFNLSTEENGTCVDFDSCAAFITNQSSPCQENGDLEGNVRLQ